MKMTETFGGRLSMAMGERSALEVAQKTGIAASTLRSYLSGVMPKADIAYALAQELDVDLTWLISGTPPEAAIAVPDNMVSVPYLERDYFADAQWSFNSHFAKNLENNLIKRAWLEDEFPGVPVETLRFLHIDGDSMAETLHNGNRCIVRLFDDPDMTMPTEGLFAVCFGGLLLIRRLVPTPIMGQYKLQADNAKFGYYDIDMNNVGLTCRPEDDGKPIKLVGRLVYLGRKL